MDIFLNGNAHFVICYSSIDRCSLANKIPTNHDELFKGKNFYNTDQVN